MKRLWIIFLAGFLLAACAPAPEQTPAPTEAAAAGPTAPAATVKAPTEVPGAVDTAPASVGCTVQTVLAPANATETSMFPAVTGADRQLGSQEAATTIVEYGDFQ